MMLGRPSRFLLFLLFVACLTPSGNGNEGSKVGSCPCDHTVSSHSPPNKQLMGHLRKHLKAYQRCISYVRFQLPLRNVCGGSSDGWVQELMRCFDSGECGHAQAKVVALQGDASLRSTQYPEPTEAAPSDTGTTSQTYLPSTLQQRTQQPTPLEGALSLDSKLILTHETTTYTSGHSLGAEPEAGENQKQLKENMGPAVGTSAMVPVLSLLAIIFFLTGALLYVVCKRRRQSLQHPPDLAAPLCTCSRGTSAQNGIL